MLLKSLNEKSKNKKSLRRNLNNLFLNFTKIMKLFLPIMCKSYLQSVTLNKLRLLCNTHESIHINKIEISIKKKSYESVYLMIFDYYSLK